MWWVPTFNQDDTVFHADDNVHGREGVAVAGNFFAAVRAKNKSLHVNPPVDR
jgi:hypothetical protein